MDSIQLFLVVLLSAYATAQGNMYSEGGCQISSSGLEPTVPVNVSCDCDQFIKQTAQSQPIDHLTITGCFNVSDPAIAPPITVIGFTQLRQPRADSHLFILTNVKSLTLSLGQFRLLPVSHVVTSHPLSQLSVQQAELSGGLTDGALAGMPELQEILFSQVDITTIRQSSLSDLPKLHTLSIIDSSCTFVNQRALMGVPRLTRLVLLRNSLQFVRSNAFDIRRITSDSDDDMEPCPKIKSEVLTVPSPSGTTIFISGNDFHSISREALTFDNFNYVVFSNNSVGSIGEQSLRVSFQPSAACQPDSSAFFQFTDNELADVREQALVVTNSGTSPASLIVGGNSLLQAALSPRQLNITGSFLPVTTTANRYACECCECSDINFLLDQVKASGEPREEDKLAELFTDAILTSKCIDGGESFSEFADTCRPGLTALLKDVAAGITAPPLVVVVVLSLMLNIRPFDDLANVWYWL